MVTNGSVPHMADRYTQFEGSPPGKFLVKQLGLPNPKELRRYEPGQPLLGGPALSGAAAGGRQSAEHLPRHERGHPLRAGPALTGAAAGGRVAAPVAGVLGDAGAEWF